MNRNDKSARFYNPLFHILARIIFRLTLFIVMIYNKCISGITIIGRENLISPHKGSFLISNHTLYLDPAIIAHVIAPHRTCFTALEKTFNIFFIGTYIRCLGAFPISETMPVRFLIRNIKNIFKKGYYIHFFPEGELFHLNTRINNFKKGVFVFAFRLNKPVIPVTIIAAPRRFLNSTLNKFCSKVTIKIGKPVYPYLFKKKNLTIKQQILSMADYCRKVMEEDIKQKN
ncbi:MAG: 1-acyl-sn-glycerol-3-phosphate acyltransferase [Spirochaetales bacterium]|nr:1-acyl-sn-glycerol-3-phosphate acyltransferase [Spirochaetales bacterium]